MVNIIEGGSWFGNGLALVGLLITCVGHWITAKLHHHQEVESAADKERVEDLLYRVEEAEGKLNNPDLQRAVEIEASRYAIEHQDDGR